MLIKSRSSNLNLVYKIFVVSVNMYKSNLVVRSGVEKGEVGSWPGAQSSIGHDDQGGILLKVDLCKKQRFSVSINKKDDK